MKLQQAYMIRAASIMSEFQRSLPRKRRQNVFPAFWKLRNGRPLNRYEKIVIDCFIKYLETIDWEEHRKNTEGMV